VDHAHRHAAATHARFDDVPGGRSDFARIGGIDVHYAVAGRGDVDLLLLHHFYGNVRTWRRLMHELADDARLIAFDRPGFGWTERPTAPEVRRHAYTRATASALALGLLDHLGIDRAVVVGASAGGTLALRLAAEHPDRVAGLVLLAPAVGGDVGPPASLRPFLRTAPARAVGSRIVRRAARAIDHARVGNRWADPTLVTDDDVAAYAAALTAPRWSTGLWDAMTAEDPPDLWRRLAGITAPALVLAGDQDRVVHPRWARRAADLLPNSRFRLLEHTGHTPHEERPDLVAAAIRDFLAETELR
jgi:pimeloyl-ACP methyl ester carboxylesterase